MLPNLLSNNLSSASRGPKQPSIGALHGGAGSLESQLQTSKVMLKRLNFIQSTLDGYDPVKTKRMYRSKVENSKNQRIWELWREELNETSVKDIALKVENE